MIVSLIDKFDFIERLTAIYHDISVDRWPSRPMVEDVARRAKRLGLPKREIDTLISVLTPVTHFTRG